MNVEHLVQMANQIEAFFHGEPDRELAVSGIVSHLKRFWEPRMRKAIAAHVAGGGEGLGPLARDAVLRLSA
jgi:formate dehydrogenase subunit delta